MLVLSLLFLLMFFVRVLGIKGFLPILLFANTVLLIYVDKLTWGITCALMLAAVWMKSTLGMIVLLILALGFLILSKLQGFFAIELKGFTYIALPMIALFIEKLAKKNQFETLSSSLAAVAFFPTQLAGPIYSITKLSQQLGVLSPLTSPQVRSGFLLIAFGAVKLALYGYLNKSDSTLYSIYTASGVEVLLLALNLSIKYYLNLSGYTDIVRGMAGCLGIELPINFNLPFLAWNVAEHWRRWHVSLIQWFHNYVFMPLGMYLNRKHKSRVMTGVAVMATCIVIAFWHDLTMNYFVWGILNGVLILSTPIIFGAIRKLPGGTTVAILLTILLTSLLRLLTLQVELSTVFGAVLRLFQFSAQMSQAEPFLFGLFCLVGATLGDWVFLEKSHQLQKPKVFWPSLIILIITLFFFNLGPVEILYGEF